MASDQGTGVANTVRAFLTDQYGGPVVRERIIFTSNDRDGVPDGVRRSTSSGGVATLNYQRDSANSGSENITATFEGLSHTIRHYWVTPASAGSDSSGKVVVADTTRNTIVVTSGAQVVLIKYDTNDQYRIAADTVTLSDFEEALTVGDHLAYTTTGTAEAVVNTFSLTNR